MNLDPSKSRLWNIISNNLHYGGLLLVSILIYQNQTSTHFAEKTLKESIERQESLRNTLWVNLLAQRSGVLALTSILKKDGSYQEKAQGVAQSIPRFLPQELKQKTNSQIHVTEDTLKLEQLLSQPLALPTEEVVRFPITAEHPSYQLIDTIDELGVELNTVESEEWYKLVDYNSQILSGFKERKIYSHATYILFAFYVFLLWWMTIKRKKAESFLRQSESRQRMLSEASFEALVISDASNYIMRVNPAFQTLFGVTEEKAKGQPVSHFFTNDLGHSKHRGSFPIEISEKQSTMDNQMIRILAIRDLSEKQEAENMRLEKEAAERANKSKSVFLANMSHELRTPMHGVLSYARFGMKGAKTKNDHELGGFFEEIFDSGSRLMQLLNDLLDLAKLESGKMTYTMSTADLSLICQRSAAELSAFAKEKNVDIDFECLDADSTASFDSERIHQVVNNILSNAIKFSFPNTVITMRLKIDKEKMTCTITNSGSGIPQQELTSVFDKFVQSSKTRSGAGGTGLGLAICAEIIDQHGGKIWAESELNQQTSFIFEIPKDSTHKIMPKKAA